MTDPGPVLCFIDDSPFEIDLFRDLFAGHFTEVTFLCGFTFDEVHAALRSGGLAPSLFILDLYGRTDAAPRQIPSREALERRAAQIPTLAQVYAEATGPTGTDDPDLRVNEYLKRLFGIVAGWRELFAELAAGLDQSTAYGSANLRHVRAHYPGVPGVAYTRKGLLADAIQLLSLGADGIYMKPGGATDEDIRAATIAQRDDLMRAWLSRL